MGCSVALHLARRGVEVCVLEKEDHLAMHQSGRNSGVLHPGFNYPPGSMKARFSTEGTRRMKEYCRKNGVPLDECGVLVVAQNDEEVKQLRELEDQAEENGVDAWVIDEEEVRKKEPHASGVAALYCPEAASVDSQKYVHSLAADSERAGVDFYMGYRVTGVEGGGDGFVVRTNKGDVEAGYVVNATGLYADRVADWMGVGGDVKVVPFRGEYYELKPERRSLVNSMVYPAPDPDLPFLGVHFTRRTDGKVIVGPNAVLAFGREAYSNTEFDLGELAGTLSYRGFWRLLARPAMLGVAWSEFRKSYRKKAFVEAARRLVPDVAAADFVRSYSGVRAQLVSREGELVRDPVVRNAGRSTHVLNAVSPGLTSSLPFGEYVSEEVLGRL